MRNLLTLLIFGMGLLLSCAKRPVNVLVFTKANGFKHESRITGAQKIKALQKSYPMRVIISEDSLLFNDDSLSHMDVVVFLSTSGTILGTEQKTAFQNFIHRGGGFVGIHGATTTEYDWPWFGKLIGAYFDKHPKLQPADVHVIDYSHPSTRHLPDVWRWEDEWYDWRSPVSKNVSVLMTVDENSYQGGESGNFHPVCWYQEFEGGRVWYTALGHKTEHYSNPVFIKHIAEAIMWAGGR